MAAAQPEKKKNINTVPAPGSEHDELKQSIDKLYKAHDKEAKEVAKVEGAAMIKRHQKPAGNRGGGIIDKEAWIDISNVQVVDPQSGKPSRVGYKIDGDGTKFRVATTSGHSLEK